MPIQVLVAFLILLILNVFMLFILKTLSLRLSLKFKNDASKLFANYTEILDKQKQRMLEEYQIEIEKYAKTNQVEKSYNCNDLSNEDVFRYEEPYSQEYRDDELFDKYNFIKSINFASKEDLESIRVENIENIEYVKEFRNLFDIDKIYTINSVQSTLQFDIVEELINSNNKYEIVRNYLTDDKFNIVEFISKLDYIILSNPSSTTIYKARGSRGNYEVLDSIIEGYIVTDGKKIYDYSLKKGDVISG